MEMFEMSNNLKITLYTAGAIEADTASGMSGWRNKVDEFFKPYTDIAVYNPIKMEKSKTNKPAGEHIKYVEGLIRSGNKDLALEEMDKIWLGNIRPDHELIEVFKLMRHRKIMDGNSLNEFCSWGDYEAVIRSDFIIAYIKKPKIHNDLSVRNRKRRISQKNQKNG